MDFIYEFFDVEPKPAAAEIERILADVTIQWTIRRSSPQFGVMSELIYNTPDFRRHGEAIIYKGDYFAVLMAAAAEACLSGRISEALMWPVFKLHVTADPGEWLELSARDRKALKSALSRREMWVPIYRWQGAAFLEGEEWANCLGVPDTRRFVALVARGWKENWPVPRMKEMSRVEIRPAETGLPRFRDCGVWEDLVGPTLKKVTRFKRPCVYFEWQ